MPNHFASGNRMRVPLGWLFVDVALVVLSISHLVTSIRLQRSEETVRSMRREYGYLYDINEEKVNVISVPTLEQETWRWRVYIPKGKKYRLYFRLNGIPETGLPTPFQIPDKGVPLERDGEMLLSVKVVRMPQDESVRGLSATWLDRETSHFESSNDEVWHATANTIPNELGVGAKVTLSADEPVVLMRRINTVAGRETYPAKGVMIWLDTK